MEAFEARFEFLRPPGGMRGAEFEDGCAQGFGHGAGLVQGDFALVFQGVLSGGLKAAQPFVAGWPRNAEVSAQS
jgi:hypothetical protein